MTQHVDSRQYHHGDLRKALIHAGLELALEEGFAAVDIRKVARKVGVSHTASYRHFQDKEALLAAICTDGFERLNATLEDTLSSVTDDKREQVRTFVHTYVFFALENAALVREMLSGLFVNYQQYPSMVAAMLIAPQILHRLLPPGAESYSALLMYAVNGLTLQKLKQLPVDRDALEQEIEQLVGVLWRGITLS